MNSFRFFFMKMVLLVVEKLLECCQNIVAWSKGCGDGHMEFRFDMLNNDN